MAVTMGGGRDLLASGITPRTSPKPYKPREHPNYVQKALYISRL